jgi:hypothetical protein
MRIDVHRLSLVLRDPWLEKMVRFGLEAGAGKLPLTLAYESSKFTATGAEITLKARKGIIRAALTACIDLSGFGPDCLAVRVTELRLPALLPDRLLKGALDLAIAMALQQPGIARHPEQPRAILLDPNLLLQHKGLPLHFASGGAWTVGGGAGELAVDFRQLAPPPVPGLRVADGGQG